jgi:hypothetical protein
MKTLPDVVYSVKADESNEELRYSLRSLSNIPHGQVFIAGYMPSWVQNVQHIDTRQQRLSTKYVNSRRNWYLANKDPRVAKSYIHMNDDFFFMKPMSELPVFRYEGTLETFISKHKALGSIGYVEGAERTLKMLMQLGIEPEYFSYELHVPMTFEKDKINEIVEIHHQMNKYNQNIHTRTLYGNYFKIGGEPIPDVKFHHTKNDRRQYKKMDLLSTSDISFNGLKVGKYIREQFLEKCEYEK